MSKIPFLDLGESTRQVRPEVDRAIAGIIDNTSFVLGPEVDKFERAFADYCGTGYCIGTSSGTSALQLLLRGFDVGPGDEVITVPNTFIATAEAIEMVGAKPVFVDVDEKTWLMDSGKLEEVITERTKAVIPVHLFGQCCDMDSIMEIAGNRGVIVIEDACQAHGATYRGRKAGSLGDAAAFSFYPSKNLGAFGEGGAITTDKEEICQRIISLRNHAQTEKNRHNDIGYNYRLDSIQAAVLNVKLNYLDQWNDGRRRAARRYKENLRDTGFKTPEEKPENKHVYHLFPVCCTDKQALQKALSEEDIGWGEHYPIPVHLQEAFSHLGLEAGSFPAAEKLMAEHITLPMYPELKLEDVDRVCEVLKDISC